MRHAAQCLGRVLRGKDDYGIMVLADRRFQKKRNQLPKWINQALLDADTNLSTDMAVSSARRFLRTMAQPFRAKDQEGISTWGYEDLMQHKEKVDMERIRELEEEGVSMVKARKAGYENEEFEDERIDQDMMDMGF
jgi:DNA excision repair protein ERCC-2